MCDFSNYSGTPPENAVETLGSSLARGIGAHGDGPRRLLEVPEGDYVRGCHGFPSMTDRNTANIDWPCLRAVDK